MPCTSHSQHSAADDTADFLEALCRITKAAGDEQWLRQQSAAELAQIHNVLFDRTVRLLTALGVLRAPSNTPTPLAPEPVDREAVLQIARRLQPAGAT